LFLQIQFHNLSWGAWYSNYHSLFPFCM
jgi:hypothetical protein